MPLGVFRVCHPAPFLGSLPGPAVRAANPQQEDWSFIHMVYRQGGRWSRRWGRVPSPGSPVHGTDQWEGKP